MSGGPGGNVEGSAYKTIVWFFGEGKACFSAKTICVPPI